MFSILFIYSVLTATKEKYPDVTNISLSVILKNPFAVLSEIQIKLTNIFCERHDELQNVKVDSACSKNGVIINKVREVSVSFDCKIIARGGDRRELQPRTDKLKLAGDEVG